MSPASSQILDSNAHCTIIEALEQEQITALTKPTEPITSFWYLHLAGKSGPRFRPGQADPVPETENFTSFVPEILQLQSKTPPRYKQSWQVSVWSSLDIIFCDAIIYLTNPQIFQSN